MKKEVKILICGLGSIGQRHYENLINLGYRNIIAYRTGKGVNKMFIGSFSKKYKPVVFRNLNRALKEKPEIVFITNPSSLHVSTALMAVKEGAHVFIEKPLSNVIDKKITKLQLAVKKNNRTFFVAYNFRFHPLLIKIKNILESDQIGKPLSANVQMGERVSNWHPWENYKKSYASRKDLGGGVVLTQSHDLDYLSWLFGRAKKVTAKGGIRGELGINAEDCVDMLISYRGGVEALVHIDYVQTPPTRILSVVGTKGKADLDFNNGSLVVYKYGKAKPVMHKEPKNFDRSQMYIDEVKYFMDCLEKKKTPFNNLSESIVFLKFLLTIKKQLTH